MITFCICGNDHACLRVFSCFSQYPHHHALLNCNVTYYNLLRLMSSIFQVEFHLHQQPFRTNILVFLLPLLLKYRFFLSQNHRIACVSFTCIKLLSLQKVKKTLMQNNLLAVNTIYYRFKLSQNE